MQATVFVILNPYLQQEYMYLYVAVIMVVSMWLNSNMNNAEQLGNIDEYQVLSKIFRRH
jgi:hypothetical protein